MGTRHITIDHEYVEIGAQLESTFYVQNKGSSRIELYIGDTSPFQVDEGLVVYPNKEGLSITLEGSELCYAKTEDKNNTSILVVAE